MTSDEDSARRQRAVQYLLKLRQPGPRPVSLPATLAPRDEAEAYQLQSDIMQALDAKGGCWKVAMQDATRGTSAPVFASQVHYRTARVSSSIVEKLGVEPEVAFTLRRALPPLPDGRRYQMDQVVDAIGSAHAAIEIVISRFASHEGAAPLDRLADNISNGGLVLGPSLTNWRQLDMRTLPLRLSVQPAAQAAVIHEALGGHPLDNPLLPLLWLANHCSQRALGLRAGDIVTTGSFAGVRYVGPATHVSVQFEGLGLAELYS
jgi:2-keto-4-pentenoate hydratase